MQTLDVQFQKNFHTNFEDRYLMETIFIKVAPDSIGEDIQFLLDKAREEAHLNHKRNNPHLFPPGISIVPKSILSQQQEIGMRELGKQIDEQKEKELPEQINSCTELKVLETYKFIVKGKPDLQTIYDNKLKSLQ